VDRDSAISLVGRILLEAGYVESVIGVTECINEVNVVDSICGETVVVGSILGKTDEEVVWDEEGRYMLLSVLRWVD
jgi:hypothetical protein